MSRRESVNIDLYKHFVVRTQHEQRLRIYIPPWHQVHVELLCKRCQNHLRLDQH